MSVTPRINIDITADDQTEGELIARLIAASLDNNGFTDITNTSGHHANDQEEEVVASMMALNPEIFNSEVTIDVTTFEEGDEPITLSAADDESGPGVGEFPEAGTDNDDDIPED
jgi:hypothetical protein